MSIHDLIYRDNTPLERASDVTERLVAPYKYLEKVPGNKIRTAFMEAFNRLYFGVDNDTLMGEINDLVNILHDSSLLIDDVEDNSEFRRGEVCAHIKFGAPLTINGVCMMYFIAIRKSENLAPLFTEDVKLQTTISIAILRIITDEMLNLHHGQGLDIYWRDNLDMNNLPSEEEYYEMVMDKTGGLLRLMVKLLLAFVPSKSCHSLALASLMGIIYQLRDDYFNLTSDRYSHNKGTVGEDIIEGKMSFPILHCLRSTNDSPLHQALLHYTVDQRKTNPELIKLSIDFMEHETKSLLYTKELLLLYITKGRQMISEDETIKHGDCGLLYELFDYLGDL